MCYNNLESTIVYRYNYRTVKSVACMKNVTLLERQLQNAISAKAHIPVFFPDGKSCIFYGNQQVLTVDTVSELIAGLFLTVHSNSLLSSIIIAFPNGVFDEKFTYVLLECYLEHIIADHGISVRLLYNKKETNIFTDGIGQSPLCALEKSTQSSMDFVRQFRFDVGKNYYRKLFLANENSDETLSSAITTLCLFFEGLGITKTRSDLLSEVAVELVGNALEHSCSDCFLDIDVTPCDYVRRNNPNGPKYYGVNICVVNFSPTLLSSQIQSKLCVNPELRDKSDSARYWRLRKIYMYHRRFFREDYGDDEFFMLSAFQDRISGRPNEYLTGGTGLPTLIKWLETQADSNNCYVLSGRRKMQFLQPLLEYDAEHWIGMNQEHDFQHCAPDKNVFLPFPIYFPGTAYNLNFVMETEE